MALARTRKLGNEALLLVRSRLSTLNPFFISLSWRAAGSVGLDSIYSVQSIQARTERHPKHQYPAHTALVVAAGPGRH